MADISSTSTDEAAEAVDTSVESDNTTEDTDVDLEDIEVDLGDIESESDDEEEGEDTEDTESEEETTDDESEDESESTDEEKPELTDEQNRAQHNKEMFEQRQRDKQARIDRIKADQQAYVQEASEVGDPVEIAVRQLQVDAYNNKVDALSNKLTNGYEKAIKDFPVLTTQDPVIQAEIDAAIDAFQAQHVVIDAYGNPIEVKGDLYATLQAKADAIEKLTGIRVRRQEQSKSKEKTKTLATPTRAPKQPKVDPDLAAFDEEAGL